MDAESDHEGRVPGAVQGSSCDDRVETIAGLAARMGIDTLLVSIPKVARALGYAPSTLHAYIAAGKFFLPVRTVNGSPLVALDDLVDWVSSRTGDTQPGEPSGRRRPSTRRGAPGLLADEMGGCAWRAEAERRALAKASAARVRAARDSAALGGPRRRGRPPKQKGPSSGSAPSA